MKRCLILVFLIMLIISCNSIKYPCQTKQQVVLEKFVDYIYENRNDLVLDSLQNFPLIKINFSDLKYLNEDGLKGMLNKYPNGIELCNKYRERSFRNGRNKTIWLIYYAQNTNYYLTFVFDSDIEETYYEFTTFFERENISCNLRDLQRVIVVPE